MNARLVLLPAAGVLALALEACGAVSQAAGHQATAPSVGASHRSATMPPSASKPSTYAAEVATIKAKGYTVIGSTPTASVQTSGGGTLTAWLANLTASQDGHNQYVFFFHDGKYVGTGAAHPSLEIAGARPAGRGSIAVKYPVYKKTDSFANPTGTPVTITYHWDGTKLVASRPYPKQFS